MDFAPGDKLRTSNDRTYEVLGGPYSGNNGTLYVVREEQDDIIELKSDGVLKGMCGGCKDEKF